MRWRSSASSRRKPPRRDLGKRPQREIRRRAHRRDRARSEARRHRVPHASVRDRRPRSALRASGHDVVRRARHLPLGAARTRGGYSDRRRGRCCSPRSSAAPSSTNTPSPSAAATASMPSPRPSASSSRASMRSLCARGRGSSRRARRSPSAPSPARSAPSPISIRAWKRMSRRSWGSKSSRSPRR